jgi:adenylylsulfate kinase
LLASAGLICLTAFVSPYRRDRDRVRNWVTNQDQSQESTPFFEVFVNTSLEVCMQRDPKGLYQQALAGKIPNFTGISDPYEAPVAPELELQGGSATPIELAEQVLKMLQKHGIVSGP